MMSNETQRKIQELKDALDQLPQESARFVIRFLPLEYTNFIYHMNPSGYKVLGWN